MASKQAAPRPIPIRKAPIELSQFVKLANVVMTGGEAKSLIQAGEVKVNGEFETRRSRKLQVGDIVDVAGMLFEVVLGER